MPDTAETAHITAPRSMAHLLRTTLMAVGILSLLLSVVGAALLFQHAFAEQFDTDLSRTVEAIAVGYEHSADPQPEQLAQYADGLRLTLVAQDGTVLYDSATADPSNRLFHKRLFRTINSYIKKSFCIFYSPYFQGQTLGIPHYTHK